MRVISGKFSGRKISSPKGKGIRPTSDRFKETLFNIIEYGWPQKHIIHIFQFHLKNFPILQYYRFYLK